MTAVGVSAVRVTAVGVTAGGNDLKGEQDAAELGANTYANHFFTKYF